MKKIINNLRSRPLEHRRHVLHLIMVVCAAVLLAFWVYSLTMNFTSADVKAKTQEDLKPFSALTGNLIDGYYSISGSAE